MAVFVCYHGRAAELALAEPGCFTLVDFHGQAWLCHESAKLPTLAHQDKEALLVAHAENLMHYRRVLSGQGVRMPSTRSHIAECSDTEALRDQLSMLSLTL
jgi:hypothetical protein